MLPATQFVPRSESWPTHLGVRFAREKAVHGFRLQILHPFHSFAVETVSWGSQNIFERKGEVTGLQDGCN